MLASLHIENIAVIEKADILFGPGFHVLTGETGAGKSIVIDALNAVLGERISRDLVRTGNQTAHISALFTELPAPVTAVLEEQGYAPDEEGSLLIQRSISAEGKGFCRIGGRPATVSILRMVGRMLVNIHGQHENQALLSVEKHVEYLDKLGNLLPLRAAYEATYRRYCHIRHELKKVDMDETAKAQRLDILEYQIEEIETAQPLPEEQNTLLARRTMYRNAEKIVLHMERARIALSGDDEENMGVLSGLSVVSSSLKEAGKYMEEVLPLSERVETFLYDLEECAEELRTYTARLDFDASELEETETRLDVLRRLCSKYGATEEAVLEYLEQAQEERDNIRTSDVVIQRLQAELEQVGEETVAAAAALTQARKEAAVLFSQQVMEELSFLDMPGVALEVSIQKTALTSTGGDKVEFLISANPGEPAKSIARIASGGELSRIMLALKSVLAQVDDIDTLVFDEIDTGISGRAANKVGIKLREIAANRQVLCVTHLAQIAAMAHAHLLIAKTVRNNRTYTQVTVLDKEGREQELARIIGGEVTDVNRKAAREMLQHA